MSISRKLILLLLAISLIPAILVSYLSITINRSALEKQVTASFQNMAEEKATFMASIIDDRVREAERLARQQEVVEAVRRANAAYADLTEEEALASILAEDEEWIARKGDTQLAKTVLDAPLSDLLKRYQSFDHSRYGELFITDRRSAAIAMTQILTDYYQADEQWWVDSFVGGRGAIFIDDRGMDLSINALAMGVVVPIMDRGTAIGVLKINYKVTTILDIVADEAIKKQQITAFLARSQGTLLASNDPEKSERLSKIVRAVVKSGVHGAFDDMRWEEALMVVAPVTASIHTRILAPGAVKGVSGEVWEPTTWNFFMEIEKAVAYASIIQTRNLFVLIAIFIAVAALILAVILGRTITRPVEALVEGTRRIAEGNLDYKVSLHRSDELGVLSGAFDDMTASLKRTTASRDELEQEVEERKRMELSLRRAKETAENANHLKDQFVSLVSHDIRSPLSSVAALIKQVQSDKSYSIEPSLEEIISSVGATCEHVVRMTEALLKVSRLQSGAIVLEQERIELDQLVTDVLEVNALTASQKKIELVARDIPKGSAIWADRSLIAELMQNLISNAIKFTPSKGVVAICCAQTEEETVISISDTGVGVKPERVADLFMPGVNRTTHGSAGERGTGLGLLYANDIAHAHEGKIAYERSPGGGSRFSLHLPRSVAP